MGAVGDECLDPGGGWTAEATVERGHLIAALQGGFDDGAAHVVGAAEDEHFHDAPDLGDSRRADGWPRSWKVDLVMWCARFER